MRAPQVRTPSFSLVASILATLVVLHAPRSAGATAVDDLPAAPAPAVGGDAAYLIITTDDLAREFERLAAWKRSSGVAAEVHTLSEIRLLVPTAADDAERIRTFLQDAHANHGARWVLLGGDVESIPIRFATLDLSGLGFGLRAVPTDLYYACLDGNWNANGNTLFGESGDDVDVTPDVFVGRAPVKTVLEVRRFVHKTIQYERAPDPATSHAVVLVAGRLTLVGDLAPFAEPLVPVLTAAPGVELTRLYANSAAWPGSSEANRASVLAAFESGPDFVTLIEAGGTNAIATVDEVQSAQYITTPDVLALENAPRYFNAVTVGSSVNRVSEDVSIGEALVRAPDGGAVTLVAPTDLQFVSAGDAMLSEYVRLLYTGSVQTVGEAVAGMIAPFAGASDISHLLIMGFLLLGDPGLHPRTAPTQPLAAAPARLIDPDAVSPRATRGEVLTRIEPRAAEGSPMARGSSLTFAAAGPNPASASLRLSGSIPAPLEGAPVDLSVFDLAGRRVRVVDRGVAHAGPLSTTWDLADDSGRRVPGGLYFMRLTVGHEARTRRVVVSP